MLNRVGTCSRPTGDQINGIDGSAGQMQRRLNVGVDRVFPPI